MSSDQWIVNATVANAISAVLNVVLVGALVYITWRYTKSTAAILEESRKARLAAENQASVAQSSLNLLQQQISDQFGLGRSIVQSAVASAVSAIEYWKNQDLKRLPTFNGLPPTDSLVPANAPAAVDHARRISVDAAQELSDAFDALRSARNEIESMRHVETGLGKGSGFFDGTSALAQDFLETAFKKIQKAQATLLVPGRRH